MHHFKQEKFKHLPLTFKKAQISSRNDVHTTIRVGRSEFHYTPFFMYAEVYKPISKCVDFLKTQFINEE